MHLRQQIVEAIAFELEAVTLLSGLIHLEPVLPGEYSDLTRIVIFARAEIAQVDNIQTIGGQVNRGSERELTVEIEVTLKSDTPAIDLSVYATAIEKALGANTLDGLVLDGSITATLINAEGQAEKPTMTGVLTYTYFYRVSERDPSEQR